MEEWCIGTVWFFIIFIFMAVFYSIMKWWQNIKSDSASVSLKIRLNMKKMACVAVAPIPTYMVFTYISE